MIILGKYYAERRVKVVGKHSRYGNGLYGWGKKHQGRSLLFSLVSRVTEDSANRGGTAKVGMYIFNYSVSTEHFKNGSYDVIAC